MYFLKSPTEEIVCGAVMKVSEYQCTHAAPVLLRTGLLDMKEGVYENT